ncbi:MAG TPA: DUF2959 domain-containing protein [Desulfobacteraceae bacterium]|nr:DUF2959 domain-containing protein [Desulfobacteraceae bacterium]|tara:strand:- start:555 stop:1199 length:645 start_codon:yes stop_codon:yes gene_type:complete
MQTGPAKLLMIILCACVLGSCSSAYYATMEKLGKEKRHLLKDNVEDVQESQTKAQEEFKDALTRIKEITGFKGGELESFYNRLKSSYEDCNDRAAEIEKRIDKVETVAADLFAEWQTEIGQINDTRLKSSSKASLAEAKAKYQKLSYAMNQSTKGMYPVLAKLNDYVLYLKHNLNARAVGALGSEVVSIEQEVTALIQDMNRSIRAADNFIKTF